MLFLCLCRDRAANDGCAGLELYRDDCGRPPLITRPSRLAPFSARRRDSCSAPWRPRLALRAAVKHIKGTNGLVFLGQWGLCCGAQLLACCCTLWLVSWLVEGKRCVQEWALVVAGASVPRTF